MTFRPGGYSDLGKKISLNACFMREAFASALAATKTSGMLPLLISLKSFNTRTTHAPSEICTATVVVKHVEAPVEPHAIWTADASFLRLAEW